MNLISHHSSTMKLGDGVRILSIIRLSLSFQTVMFHPSSKTLPFLESPALRFYHLLWCHSSHSGVTPGFSLWPQSFPVMSSNPHHGSLKDPFDFTPEIPKRIEAAVKQSKKQKTKLSRWAQSSSCSSRAGFRPKTEWMATYLCHVQG